MARPHYCLKLWLWAVFGQVFDPLGLTTEVVASGQRAVGQVGRQEHWILWARERVVAWM